jgi:hydrogenase maturation protease
MSSPRVLIAGIGNIFLGDDAFGVEVVRRLLQCELPAGVDVVDFGIRGLDLAYALSDGYEEVILVDATPRGEPPGTLYMIEPEPGGGEVGSPSETSEVGPMEMHGLDPLKVLRLARVLGGQPKHVLLVGCEPERLGNEEDMAMGLSRPVQLAVEEAVSLVQSLLPKLLAGPQPVGSS